MIVQVRWYGKAVLVAAPLLNPSQMVIRKILGSSPCPVRQLTPRMKGSSAVSSPSFLLLVAALTGAHTAALAHLVLSENKI